MQIVYKIESSYMVTSSRADTACALMKNKPWLLTWPVANSAAPRVFSTRARGSFSLAGEAMVM